MRKLTRADMFFMAGLALSLAALLVSIGYFSSAKRGLSRAKAKHAEIISLRDEYSPLKRRVSTLESRKSLTRVEGVVEAVDKIFEPLGLKGKIKSVKPIGAKEASEEKAEVTVQGVDMNEMVNILYKMEYAPMLIVVRKVGLSTSFENPKLLNMTITLSLITG